MLALTATIGLTAAALPLVTFSAGQDQIVRFRRERVPVYDASLTPRFIANRAYVLAAAGNASGRVYAWDQSNAFVQVAAPAAAQLWLACRDLEAMPLACAARMTLDAGGAIAVSAIRRERALPTRPVYANQLANLPNCPGDPRCPASR